MSLKVDDLFKTLAEAAATGGQALFQKARTFLLPELKQVASRLVSIEASVQAGELDRSLAKQLMDMQVDSAVDVIVAMTELTALEAQKLINAALKAIRDTVNTAIGFKLI